MKKSAYLLLLGLSFLLFNTCKKNNSSPTIPRGLTYKVDGVLKRASMANANLSDALTITGFNGKEGVGITIMKSGPIAKTFLYTDNSNTIYANHTDGTVTILSQTDNNVTGTFQFVGYDLTTNATKTITEGQFNCDIIH